MAIWVNLNRAAKFPEVQKVYKRAGWGQGGGESQAAGFLQTVRKAVTLSNGAALPSWIRKSPLASNDWQACQVDVTAIPGVRPLNANGKAQGFAPL